jgi:hypothetical protein
MNMKKWTLLVAMMGVLIATAFAGEGNEANKNRADFLKEQRTYFKENIKPVMDKHRNELEPSISAEDKKEVARLREEIIKQKLMQNEFMFEARASRIKGEDVDEGLFEEIKTQHIFIENLYDEAKLIANKYRPEIDDLLASVKEEGKEWRGQRHERSERFDGNKGRKGDRGGNGRYGRQHSGEMGHGFGPEPRREINLVTFLLWDVNRG